MANINTSIAEFITLGAGNTLEYDTTKTVVDLLSSRRIRLPAKRLLWTSAVGFLTTNWTSAPTH